MLARTPTLEYRVRKLVRRHRGKLAVAASLAATAILLLAVCCANLAGLLGAQSVARAREFAIRLSLGAGVRCIVRQVVTESLLLALDESAGE